MKLLEGKRVLVIGAASGPGRATSTLRGVMRPGSPRNSTTPDFDLQVAVNIRAPIRLGRPQEMAEPIVLLSGPGATVITGHCLIVADGAMS